MRLLLLLLCLGEACERLSEEIRHEEMMEKNMLVLVELASHSRTKEKYGNKLVHTFADEDSALMVLDLKRHVLKLHLQDTLDGSSTKEFAQVAIGSPKVTDWIHHGLFLLGFPV